jgi:hypothetical protein
MWRRLLMVAVCIINNDRHCDPVVPIDTTVDPRFPCQADANFGTFGKLFSNNSITVEFQYQIETTTTMTTTTTNTTGTTPVSDMALKQVERALSNVLANSFFECRRRRERRTRQRRRNRNRNLQDEEVIMSLDSLIGISAAPADLIHPGGA